MQFDLLIEPWIPVRSLNGETREVSLRSALCKAHLLSEICDPIPTVEFGLYRLLVALVHDIFRPEITDDLGEILDAGVFDAEIVDRYFKQHADRFDLFHKRFPFLQTGGMENEDAKPLAGLLPLIPSGTNVFHFHHSYETEFGVSPAAAARLLTIIAPFMTAGGAGLSPSINGAPPWYVRIAGDTLFETLCLNTSVIPPQKYGTGNLPSWRLAETVKQERYKKADLLPALTWQPRRIQLIPGGPGRCSITNAESPVRVSTMRFTAGAGCDFLWTDPNVPYKITEKGKLPMRPQEEKELWRDTGPLLLLRDGDLRSEKGRVQFERPALVSQLSQMFNEGLLIKHNFPLVKVYGMRTDMKMKVFEWQSELLQLPLKLMGKKWACAEAQNAIEKADSVSYQLKKAVLHAYPRDGAGNKAAFATLIAHAQRQYWHALRGKFNDLLGQLAELPDETEAYEKAVAGCRTWWEETVRWIGSSALKDAIGDLDTNSDAIRRQVEAFKQFNLTAWLVFHPKSERAGKQGEKSKTKKGGENDNQGN